MWIRWKWSYVLVEEICKGSLKTLRDPEKPELPPFSRALDRVMSVKVF